MPDISTAIVVYAEEKAIGCGYYKLCDADTVEIKRMFVDKHYRGKGVAKVILCKLEKWAIEEGFKYAIPQTSIHYNVARNLYETSGYEVIPNYDQYKYIPESVFMKKQFSNRRST